MTVTMSGKLQVTFYTLINLIIVSKILFIICKVLIW
jgi:hypothetical protein